MKKKIVIIGLGIVSSVCGWGNVEDIDSLLPPSAGASVLVIRNGETILKQGYGVKKIGEEDPCEASTNFRIASISKQFTSSAIMLLVERGNLSLDDKLSVFFSDAPKYWDSISIEQILTHTSGLPDYGSLIPNGTSLQLTDYNFLEMLRKTAEPDFEPGSRWAYSNTGYVLLGLIVEQASGEPYHRFVREEIFEALGMNGSRVYQPGLNSIPDRAFGHRYRGDEFVVADQSLTSVLRGDGSVYTSANGMEIWANAVLEGKLLTVEKWNLVLEARAKTSFKLKFLDEVSYGYGWFVSEYKGRKIYMHGGSTRGFALDFWIFPETDSAVLVMFNSEVKVPTPYVTKRIVDALLF